MVTEQNRLYEKAQGKRLFFAPIDYGSRVVRKVFVRALSLVGGRFVQRMSMRLQMGDERVTAHID